jgi:GT2 family glycosyltransferase
MPPSIDVVIVTFNGWALTESCLRHLDGQSVGHRVIVVDNASADETRERLRADWPDVQLECSQTNRGFAAACNLGVAAGTGDVVVLLNNDVDCQPEFLAHLVAPLNDSRVGSVAAAMVQPGGELIDSVGMCADVTLAGFPRLQGQPLAHAGDRDPVLAGPAGTAGAYRRTAWEQVGGLDGAIFAYFEDLDLALRLRAAGWEAAVAPSAVGTHLGSASFGHRSAWQRREGGFGRGYMLGRYRVLRGRHALRTLATETIVVAGDLVISHDAAALRGRVAGYRAGRTMERLAAPPATAVEHRISLGDSLALRRGVYRRHPA